jgi:hypothetical protein
MSWLREVEQARVKVEVAQDPWARKLVGSLTGYHAISTAALLDIVGSRPTTGNARSLAKVMRSLGWVPVKSRQLMPGGFRGTTVRGWMRAVREPGTFGGRTVSAYEACARRPPMSRHPSTPSPSQTPTPKSP